MGRHRGRGHHVAGALQVLAGRPGAKRRVSGRGAGWPSVIRKGRTSSPITT